MAPASPGQLTPVPSGITGGLNLYSQIERIVHETLTSDSLVEELARVQRSTQLTSPKINSILRSAADRTVEQIREAGFLTFDFRPLRKTLEYVEVPYDQFGSVGHMLDWLWLNHLRDLDIHAHTYAMEWIIHNNDSDETLSLAGLRWAEANMQVDDNRALADVGIWPGSWLEIREPPSPVFRGPQRS